MRNIPRISGDFKNWHSELVKLVETDTTVDVYRNLHKGCWSVKQGGKVVAHCDYIVLRDARFIVGQSGRDRVIRDQVKNVHAYVRGWVSTAALGRETELEASGWKWEEVSYDPYKRDSFYSLDTGKDVISSPLVDMDADATFGSVVSMQIGGLTYA